MVVLPVRRHGVAVVVFTAAVAEVVLVQAVQPFLEGSGSFSLRLDSLRLGSAYQHGAGRTGVPARYFLSVSSGAASGVHLEIARSLGGESSEDSTFFPAVPVAATAAGRYGGTGAFDLRGRVALAVPGSEYAGSWGRGCLAGAAGFGAAGTTGCSTEAYAGVSQAPGAASACAGARARSNHAAVRQGPFGTLNPLNAGLKS